jgi:uncharacterized protein
MKYIKWVILLGILAILSYSILNRPSFSSLANKERAEYRSNLLNMESPPLKDDEGIQFFEPDEKWIIDAKFEKLPKNENYKMAMTDTSKADAVLMGKLKFEINGKTYALLVFEEGETFMLPFKDKTNGLTSYGGGRYVNILGKDLDPEHIHIDFNQAHNFYCAYNESYICPVPPAENQLDIQVNAGEMNFKKP